jgi:uncharacterized membrane protein
MLATLLIVSPASGRQGATVRAVLFFSPSCGHCEYVINDVLPGIFSENGGTATLYWDPAIPEASLTFFLASNGTLEILLVDVTQERGAMLFQSATTAFDIDSNGVPRLVVGDRYLIGSADIPEVFPGIVDDALAAGTGIDWPAIPGLDDALAATGAEPPTSTTTAAVTTTLGPDAPTTTAPGGVLPFGGDRGPWERFRRDPAGNTLAVIVLVLMVAAVFGTIHRLRRREGTAPVGPQVPVLALIGLGIAAYLTYVEVAGRTAVCGPVGDCNTVQQSEYAELFGLIPIGVIGIAGYLLILGLWVAARLAPRRTDLLTVAGFAIVAGGVGFSLYLTLLEPFVIGASCAWCLGSALTITALLWVLGPPTRSAWRRFHIRSL